MAKITEQNGKHFWAGLALGLFISLVFIAVVAWLAYYVWNVGVLGIAYNAHEITYSTAFALMTGLAVAHIFVKHWVDKISQIRMAKTILKSLEKELNELNSNK